MKTATHTPRSPESGPLYLALDQGTHASRAVVFDACGEAVAQAERAIGIERPQPDHVEQDPVEVLESVRAAARAALAQLGPRAKSVAAAGLACQRSSCIAWDRRDGRALSPLFSWQDRRAHGWLAQFEPHAEDVHRKTGLFLSAHYGAGKLRWALEHLPAVRGAREAGTLCWGPEASFLAFQLCEEHPFLADPQCAARTQLWNLRTHDWDPALLAMFGLPAGFLPESVPTCGPWGTLVLDGARIPLTAVNGDQSAAVFAFGWPELDAAYINIGTSAFVQRVAAEDPGWVPRLLSGIILEDMADSLWTVEGNVNGAGSALEWLVAQPGLAQAVESLPVWLEEVRDPPLFLNGIAGLGGPFWKPGFASRFAGLGPQATPAEQAVAVVESMAFLLQANIEEMAASLPPARRIRVSGGVSRFDGLCRRIAALSGLAVHRREDPEATARGIAYLAAGRPAHWHAAQQATQTVFEPQWDAALATRYRRWRLTMAELTGV